MYYCREIDGTIWGEQYLNALFGILKKAGYRIEYDNHNNIYLILTENNEDLKLLDKFLIYFFISHLAVISVAIT